MSVLEARPLVLCLSSHRHLPGAGLLRAPRSLDLLLVSKCNATFSSAPRFGIVHTERAWPWAGEATSQNPRGKGSGREGLWDEKGEDGGHRERGWAFIKHLLCALWEALEAAAFTFPKA